MKNLFGSVPSKPLWILIAFVSINSFSQGKWEWVQGDSASPGTTILVTPKGIPHPDNQPQGGYATAFWNSDSAGWFMGGYYGNPALWKFDPYIEQWIWIDGPIEGIVSTILVSEKGEYDTLNWPKAKQLGAATWVENEKSLWLMGASSSKEHLLWNYNVDSSAWAWVSGDLLYPDGFYPTYGTKHIPHSDNQPGKWFGESLAHWVDDNGDLWLYIRHRGVTWRYDISENMWTWEAGTPDADGYWGDEIGVMDTAFSPGTNSGTFSFPTWKDSQGKLWMMTHKENSHIQMWKFDPETLEWGLMNYWNSTNSTRIYDSTDCIIDPGMTPLKPNPWENRVSWLDNCDNVWMIGPTRSDTTFMWLFVSKNNLFYKIDEWTEHNFNTKGVPSYTSKPYVKSHGAMGWVLDSKFYTYTGDGIAKYTTWQYHPDEVNANFSFEVNPIECERIHFTNLSTTGCNIIKSQHWDFGDGYTSEALNPTHIYEAAGTYEVQLIVENCTWDIDTVTYEVIIPADCFASLFEGEINTKIVPNPASESIEIYFDRAISGQVTFYNTTGSIVYREWHSETNHILIDKLSEYSEGLYIIEVKTNEQILYAKFLVVHP